MKLMPSIIAAVLCLSSITIPGVCLAASQELATPEPAWLNRMLQDGWREVQQGVLQRDLDGGRVETVTYGQSGLRWTAQKLQERIGALEREYAQHPSAELAGVIASLKSESAETDSGLKTAQAEAFAGEPVTAGCEPTFGVHAAADPLTGSQGVTASADASYSSPCGDLGNVYSYAYARATSGTLTAIKSEEDPKFDGTSLASAVSVSVNGSLDCYSEAYARAWSPALNLSYETSDTNFSCPGATSPGPTPSSPGGWTDDGAVVRLTNVADRVGIGTTAPAAALHVATESVDRPRGIVVQQSSSANASPFVVFRKSRGTIAAPTVIANGDDLGTLYGEAYDGTAFTRGGANIKFTAVGPVSPGSVPTDLVFFTGSSGLGLERMRLSNGGLVTVGVAGNTGPKLNVYGDLTVTGSISAPNQDVAEWVPAREPIAAGTVVVLDPSTTNQVTASSAAYSTAVAGVVSEQPGLILGEAGDAKVKVATTGRVRVKVDATKRPVAIGDLLVSSDVPGVAMVSEPVDVGGVKLHRPGTLIGKALQPLAGGEGEILVLLSLQ